MVLGNVLVTLLKFIDSPSIMHGTPKRSKCCFAYLARQVRGLCARLTPLLRPLVAGVRTRAGNTSGKRRRVRDRESLPADRSLSPGRESKGVVRRSLCLELSTLYKEMWGTRCVGRQFPGSKRAHGVCPSLAIASFWVIWLIEAGHNLNSLSGILRQILGEFLFPAALR